MRTRKFKCHELMVIVCAARCWQRTIGDSIIPVIARQIITLHAIRSANGSVSIEVQAEFEAIRMKSTSPVKRTLNPKVMPFDRNTDLIDIPVQRTPSIFQFAPGSLFRCATRVHLASITGADG